MTDSKGWNWNSQFDDKEMLRSAPALEVCGLMVRWGSLGMKDVLDLGCGLGRHSVLFAGSGFSVCALDISPEAVEETGKAAASKGLDIKCSEGDMLKLPYGDQSFDCVLGWNSVSHTDTEGVRKTLSEIGRVLRPSGECYLTLGSKDTWGWKQDWPKVDENTKLRMEPGPEYMVPHFYADREMLEELFGDFEIIGITHVEDWGTNNRGIHYHVHARKRS